MQLPVFVFDAYGTLFDVHAAIGRHRAAAGPDADRLSELWRTKQLEYTWTLTLAGRYEDFWTLTERALDFALARFPAVDRGKACERKVERAFGQRPEILVSAGERQRPGVFELLGAP